MKDYLKMVAGTIRRRLWYRKLAANRNCDRESGLVHLIAALFSLPDQPWPCFRFTVMLAGRRKPIS